MQRELDVGATLGWYRHGRHDPTTWITRVGSAGDFVRATWTPDGPGTLHIQWRARPDREPTISVFAYGPGGDWLASRVPSMLGFDDVADHGLDRAPHEIVRSAAHLHAGLRFGASGDLYHELLPTIIEQRITSGEAHRQWARLCAELGEPAPGPYARLLLPPAPGVLSRQPSWWFHPIGIERKRAQPLTEVARHAGKFWEWARLGPAVTRSKLHLVRGVGQWTIGSVLGPVLGDPDAVAVGDFHLKNLVGWNLAGEARATDERMIELLEPYVGQRGRVVRLLSAGGVAPPKFGPKKRVLPMHAW